MAKAPQRRRSLRLELIATLVVLLMMAVVSLSLTTELLGRRRHDADQRRQLAAHVQGLEALVTPRLGTGVPAAASRGEVEQVLRASLGTLGIESIELLRLRDSGAQPAVSLGVSVDAPPPAFEGQPAAQTVYEHRDYVIVDRPLRRFGADRGPQFVLRVASRLSPWTRVQDWQEVLVLALGVGAVLLVLGIGLVELQVIRPLAHVRNAATEIAAGNLEARTPVEGPAEIQSLASDFNTMAAALRDRIEQVESQRERLVRVEQLASVGRLSAGIAHEVGNPLAAILGYVELLLDPRSDPALPAEHRGLLERTQIQIQRIQAILTQLLDYSRPSKHATQPIAVVPAVRQLVSLLRHDPRCEGIELEVVGDPEVEALGDAALLDQILQNLIVNAARACRLADGPHQVRIFVEESPAGSDDDIEVGDVAIAGSGEKTPVQKVCIDVQDSGPGVQPDARPQLFEPFFSTAKAGEGTGLGLAICQGLAQTLGGSLRCREDGARPPLGAPEFPGAVFRVNLRRA